MSAMVKDGTTWLGSIQTGDMEWQSANSAQMGIDGVRSLKTSLMIRSKLRDPGELLRMQIEK
jgi:hypothetical protein